MVNRGLYNLEEICVKRNTKYKTFLGYAHYGKEAVVLLGSSFIKPKLLSNYNFTLNYFRDNGFTVMIHDKKQLSKKVALEKILKATELKNIP